MVVWNTTICVPDVCNGANLSQIPDFSGEISSKVLIESSGLKKLYDSKSTKACFSGKKIMFLGDSTMEETIHDIVVLLSGIGADKNVVFNYFDESRCYPPKNITLPGGVEVRMKCVNCWHSHRIMEIVMADDPAFLISHFFTGAKAMNKNGEGIDALIHFLVTKWSLIQSYDVLVLNSAMHDYTNGPEYMSLNYLLKVQELFDTLNNLNNNITKNNKRINYLWKGNVLWRTSSDIPEERQLYYEKEVDVIIKKTSSYVAFVNISHGLSFLPSIPLGICGGPHIGHTGRFRRHPFSLLWTSMCTQFLLNGICTQILHNKGIK